jgi:hypothetical protein
MIPISESKKNFTSSNFVFRLSTLMKRICYLRCPSVCIFDYLSMSLLEWGEPCCT